MSIVIQRAKGRTPLASCDTDLNPREAAALAFLLPLSSDYPQIEEWYKSKVVPGIRCGSRKLTTIERDGQIVAIGIAKKESDELKICTVRVAGSYIGRGLGLRVFDDLLGWLGNDQPYLTINSKKLPMFERIFEHYRFRYTSDYFGLFLPDSVELAYNESDKTRFASPSETQDRRDQPFRKS